MKPFCVEVPDEVLNDLLARLKRTRWVEDFANEDWQYGTNTAYLKELVAYWIDGYDSRKQERAINAYPQFLTEIDGMPIHFIHIRGKGLNPKPLILSHGWPWTFWEYRNVIDPLSDPAKHGGAPADAFDVVVPSLPGYGFSTPLRQTGVNFWRTSGLWVTLMEQLGYPRFAAHGADWGALITADLGHRCPRAEAVSRQRRPRRGLGRAAGHHHGRPRFLPRTELIPAFRPIARRRPRSE
jgi:pimeloyl-ACP methyl ester carboxylesterase